MQFGRLSPVASANFQVSKRGKPFTKLATNKHSPRMTRENYFKIAESQGLSTLRDQSISIMGSDNEGFMKTGKSGKSGNNFLG
mmetsp:Transcript_24476/g.30497  ORF Transcript_24476/g.30497 Transcript_24476/m.30497 type:complete len:83 (+) Transcript_24476:1691-1939(+)